ncbi:MAG: hypothetical protein ACLFPX_05525 [Candidatus Omnitrophota bacterium]
MSKASAKNTRGMVSLEYGAVAVMVLLGMITIGPYVVRSVNSYFKFMDTGIEQSFSERIEQAPPDDTLDPGEGCSCGPFSLLSCGNVDGSGCAPNLLTKRRSCTSITCENLKRREGDLLACEPEDPPPVNLTWADAPRDNGRVIGADTKDTYGYKCCFPAQATNQCDMHSDGKKIRYYTQQCGPHMDYQNYWDYDPTCTGQCRDLEADASIWCSGDGPFASGDTMGLQSVQYVPWSKQEPPENTYCSEANEHCGPSALENNSCDEDHSCYAVCDRTFLPKKDGNFVEVGAGCSCPNGWHKTTLQKETGCPAGYIKSEDTECPNGSTSYDLDTTCWYDDVTNGNIQPDPEEECL